MTSLQRKGVRVMGSLAVMPKPKVGIQEGTDLSKSTVRLIVNFGMPGNTKKLKSSEFEVDADKKMVKAHKILLDSKELKEIVKADNNLRSYLDIYCLPCSDRAFKLVPLSKVMDVDQICQDHEKLREDELVPAFLKAYPRLCRDAEVRLGGVYNPMDYPDKAEIKLRFKFRYQFVNMGVPGALQQLSKSIYRREQEKASGVMKDQVELVIQARRAIFLRLVDHLKDALGGEQNGEQKIFRDSTVKKLQEFVDSFDIYNVAGDKEGAELKNKVKAVINGIDPEALRTTDVTRDKVLAELAGVSKELSGLVENKPTRKFRAIAAAGD